MCLGFGVFLGFRVWGLGFVGFIRRNLRVARGRGFGDYAS